MKTGLPERPERGSAQPQVGGDLVRRFTLTSLLLTLFASLLVTFAMGEVVRSYVLGQVVAETQRHVDRTIPDDAIAELARGEVGVSFQDLVRDELLVPPVARVALYDGSGAGRYESSQRHADLGVHRPKTVGGEASGHELTEGPLGRQLRILIPLERDGASLGTLEIEQDFEPLAAHIQGMQVFAGLSVSRPVPHRADQIVIQDRIGLVQANVHLGAVDRGPDDLSTQMAVVEQHHGLHQAALVVADQPSGVVLAPRGRDPALRRVGVVRERK